MHSRMYDDDDDDDDDDNNDEEEGELKKKSMMTTSSATSRSNNSSFITDVQEDEAQEAQRELLPMTKERFEEEETRIIEEKAEEAAGSSIIEAITTNVTDHPGEKNDDDDDGGGGDSTCSSIRKEDDEDFEEEKKEGEEEEEEVDEDEIIKFGEERGGGDSSFVHHHHHHHHPVAAAAAAAEEESADATTTATQQQQSREEAKGEEENDDDPDKQQKENNNNNNNICTNNINHQHHHHHNRRSSIIRENLIPSKKLSKNNLHAFWRSFITIDYSQIAYVPGIRTALILMIEWLILGIGNPTTTAFQLGALFTGFTDPNGSLSRRIHYMGITGICLVVIGALLPSLVWEIPVANIIVSALVALLAGYSPIFQSQALIQALKLSTALFAINGSVYRNTNGYGGFGVSVAWTTFGAVTSLVVALLPELIFCGNHDAIRASVFQAWYAFGMSLSKFRSNWATNTHLQHTPTPTTTISIVTTQTLIEKYASDDDDDDPKLIETKNWLLKLMQYADNIRTASLCLSNAYEMSSKKFNNKINNNHNNNININNIDNEMNEFYQIIALTLRRVGLVIQFPWMIQFHLTPCLVENRLKNTTSLIKEKANLLLVETQKTSSIISASSSTTPNTKQQKQQQNDNNNNHVDHFLDALPSLVDYLVVQITSLIDDMILNVKGWPPHSSIKSIPKRLFAGIMPSKIDDSSSCWCNYYWTRLIIPSKYDPDRLNRGYAIRFAIAFTVSTTTEVLLDNRSTSAHWFPMTVALMMGPTQAATYDKVAQRVIGTLFGVLLGASILGWTQEYPLYATHPNVLIIFLGLLTYAVCVFLKPNYALFTFFITGWVFCTTVGAGSGELGITIVFRCGWTILAGILVLLVTYVYPDKTDQQHKLSLKIAAVAKAIKAYSQAVKEQYDLFFQGVGDDDEGDDDSRRHKNDVNGGINGNNNNKRGTSEATNNHSILLSNASQQVMKARKNAISARVDLLLCVHEAALTPGPSMKSKNLDENNYRAVIEPHFLAPALASDMINAVVIPQFVSLLMTDTRCTTTTTTSLTRKCCDDLLSDFDDETFNEIDRFVERLEGKKQSSNDNDAANDEYLPLEDPPSQPPVSSSSLSSNIHKKINNDRGPFSKAFANAHRRLDEASINAAAVAKAVTS